MNLKTLSLTQWVQLAACVELVAAAIGKSLAQMAHVTDGSSTAAVCFGLGLYWGAPFVGALLGKPSTPPPSAGA